jgi:cytochrome P450
VADRIVASLPRGEVFDFVDCMAARVPAEMIAAILGLPQADCQYFAPLVYGTSRAFSPIYPLGDHQVIERATQELYDYVSSQMRARIVAPRDDLLSALVADWRASPEASFDGLVFQVMGLLIGGSDTTRSGFAMLVALLLQRPLDWVVLSRNSSLIPGAVAECMRYEPPVASIPRVTTAPILIDGIEIPAGAFLRLSTMSAMRDPALYANPNRFDIRRTDHPRLHMVFGHGPHRCIGEILAKIEMEECLAAVLHAAPGIELVEPPHMIGFGGIRQITPMQVCLH